MLTHSQWKAKALENREVREEYERINREEFALQDVPTFDRQQQEEAGYADWFSNQVQAGIDSGNAWNLIPAEDVESHFSARREATRRRVDENDR